MTIRTFNTGRWYSAYGQRIAWTVLSTGNVFMKDVDRHIEYVLVLPEGATPTDSAVLAAYDHNQTAPFNQAEFNEYRKIRNELEAAARALPPAGVSLPPST